MKKLFKKVVAYVCAATMIIGTMAGVGTITARGEETTDSVILSDKGSPMIKTFDTGETAEDPYIYLGYVYAFEVSSEYKYLQLIYKGDASALDVIRIALIENTEGEVIQGPKWFSENEQGSLKTVDDTLVPAATEEEQTVVIDLEKSGFDVSKGIRAFHIHGTRGNGKLTITDARLMKSSDIEETTTAGEEVTTPDPATLEPLTLNDAESPFMKEWAPAEDIAAGEYAYLGYVYAGAPAGYKYLKMTYKGDAKAFDTLRFGFVDGPEVWFTENAAGTFKTADDTLVPAPTEEEQTVIIDLEKSGLDTAKAIEGWHVHSNAGNGKFTITDAQLLPPEKEPAALDPIVLNNEGSPFMKEWAPAEDLADGAYAYMGYVYAGAPAGYKYLQMTYTGDEKAFNELRFEFAGGPTVWFAENAAGTFKTTDETLVPAPKAEEQTVIIDLEKSGLDITQAIEGWHVHQTAGNGKFTVTDAQLLAELPSYDDLILNGDEQGLSSMIKSWTIAKPATGAQYKYLGFATLKEPTAAHKYLILTYAGDIGSLRFEFAKVIDGDETDKTAAYWFDQEGQATHFATADDSAIALDGGKGTTVVIDLEKSGIVLGDLNSVHMHAGYGEEGKDIKFSIGMARLSVKPDVLDIDKMPEEQPTTEVTTPQPTTPQVTTNAPVKVTKPAKAAIAKVTAKKKASKVVKLSLKKIKKAKGYEVSISTTKKFKKVLVKKFVKKIKVSVKSKKLKNKKKLYVRARAYVLDGKKKVFGKYSKVKTVKIKK